MRQLLVATLALSLATVVLAPALAREAEPTPVVNALFIENALRARALEEGIDLPDFATLTAEGITFDSVTGEVTPAVMPLDVALDQIVAGLGEAPIASAAAAGTPVDGVGNNIHLYANIRFFDCSPRGYYTGWQAGPEVQGFAVPNPTFPVTPFATATVWGGKAMHVEGAGWLVGLHLFMGAPVDANVHTQNGQPDYNIGLGFDTSIDTVGVGKVSMSSTAFKLFGFCLFSIDLGSLTENGILRADGDLVPANPAGL